MSFSQQGYFLTVYLEQGDIRIQRVHSSISGPAPRDRVLFLKKASKPRLSGEKRIANMFANEVPKSIEERADWCLRHQCIRIFSDHDAVGATIPDLPKKLNKFKARYFQSLYEDDYFQKKEAFIRKQARLEAEMQTLEEARSESISKGVESLEKGATSVVEKTPTRLAKRKAAEVITIPDDDYEDAFTQPAQKNTLHENQIQNNAGTGDFIGIRTSASSLNELTVRDPPCARCKNVRTCHNQATSARGRKRVACLECMINHTACPDSVARRLTKAAAGVNDQTVRKAKADMKAKNTQTRTQRMIKKRRVGTTVSEKGAELADKKGKAASGPKTGTVLKDSKDSKGLAYNTDNGKSDKEIKRAVKSLEKLQRSVMFAHHELRDDSTGPKDQREALFDELLDSLKELLDELLKCAKDLYNVAMKIAREANIEMDVVEEAEVMVEGSTASDEVKATFDDRVNRVEEVFAVGKEAFNMMDHFVSVLRKVDERKANMEME